MSKKTLPRIKNLTLSVSLIFMLSSCLLADKDEADKTTIAYEETDPFMKNYSDSLEKYFGMLEIDLIRQYKQNHESLKEASEFYDFYRNANTLRTTLIKSMNRHAKMASLEGNEPTRFQWFEDVAKGFKVKLDKEELTYAIHFDYDDLEEHALKTNGNMDDEFVKLLEITYDTEEDKYCWIKKASNGIFCSSLGNNDHFKILEQSSTVLSHDRMFYKEVRKIQMSVLNDILFRKTFCNDKEVVIDEMERIMANIKFEKNEPQLIKVRLQQLKKKDQLEVQFGCEDGTCASASKA